MALAYEDDELSTIYDSTGGYCHLCHRKVYFNNHGRHGRRGGWHVDHSKARANGGGDYFRNLRPACISCNLEKGTMSTRAIRARNGHTKAPASRAKRRSSAQFWNVLGWGAVIVTGIALVSAATKRKAEQQAPPQTW